MRILFLCTGNSCRSQMAEAFARFHADPCVEVYSAGTDPVGINPLAARVMEEAAVPLDGQHSKGLAEVPVAALDLVVTLCEDAANTCPPFPRSTEITHWPIPDPARARGGEAEVMATFRAVRDELRRRVLDLLVARGGRTDCAGSPAAGG